MRKGIDDLIGRQFSRWQVIRYHGKDGDDHLWECRCSCGKTGLVNHYNLMRKQSRSCGCLQKEAASRAKRTHGKSQHHLYGQWRGMIARCHNPSDRNYRWWGARGIKVCKRWHDFNLWLEDMEPTWSKGMTIEREDVNGNYEPANVRWATQAEQATNTRRNIYLETPWGRLTARQTALRLGINPSVFMARYHRGWPLDRLLSPKRYRRARNGTTVVDTKQPDRPLAVENQS